MKLQTTGLRGCCLLLLGYALVGANPAFAANLSTTLQAAPKVYSGNCPAKISFKGRIKLTRPGGVRYRFIRSDGARGPIKTLSFKRAGSKTVGTTWTLGGPKLTAYRGWVQLKTIRPQVVLSKRANFEMKCRAGRPDLIPVLKRPMSGIIKVKNIGSGPAGPSKLALDCRRRGYLGRGGGCPESRGLDAYNDPAFPDKVVVKVPALRAGQTYTHYLRFWRSLRWMRGQTYLFKAKADAGNVITESNETNNMTTSQFPR